MQKYSRQRLTVLSLLAISAALFSAQPSRAALVDKIVAGVNSEVILLSDLHQFDRTVSLRKELDPLFGFSQDVTGGSSANRSKVVNFLVEERLVTQAFKVSDQDIDQEIQTIQHNNNISRNDLTSFLKTKGFNFEDYRSLISIGRAKRELLDREIRNRVNISEDDIKNRYYKSVGKDASAPLEYSIQLILINTSSYKTPQAASQMADNALRSIRQGEPFADVAKRVSDAPSANQGGDLGFLASDQLDAPLKTAIKPLQRGEVSDVLKTPTGFMILKLSDLRSTESQKYLEAKEQIREELAKDEYKKQLHLWAERARNSAYTYVN